MNARLNKIISTLQDSPYKQQALTTYDLMYLVETVVKCSDVIQAVAPWISASLEEDCCAEYSAAANALLELDNTLNPEDFADKSTLQITPNN